MTTADDPTFFLVDDVPWPDEGAAATAPKALVEEAKRRGAKRKFLARGEGGFFSQYSVFPAGYTVPPHSHDHDEMIILLEGSCTMLDDDGTMLQAHDSMVLIGGYEYGFTAGGDGMTFITIRPGAASTSLA